MGLLELLKNTYQIGAAIIRGTHGPNCKHQCNIRFEAVGSDRYGGYYHSYRVKQGHQRGGERPPIFTARAGRDATANGIMAYYNLVSVYPMQ
jgi:hypothetical protein